MDDLNAMIGSILGDPAKMEQLRSVAESLGVNTGGGPPATQGNAPSGGQGIDPAAIASLLKSFGGGNPNGANTNNGDTNSGDAGGGAIGGGGTLDAVSKIAGIMGTFNQSDKNVDLMRSLKPHFSSTRAGRIDDAVRIMQLLRAWPALRDSGLLGNLGGLFGGGQK